MALTTNYSWDKPVVSGDVGAWGTKANTLFDSIDAEVKNRQTQAAAAQASADAASTAAGVADAKAVVAQGDVLEIANQPRNAAVYATVLGALPANFLVQEGIGVGVFGGTGAVASTQFLIPCPPLAVGIRITGFVAHVISNDATGTFTISLRKILRTDTGGVSTQIVFTSGLAAGEANIPVSGLTEDVAALTDYYWLITVSRASGGLTNTLRNIGLTCTRP